MGNSLRGAMGNLCGGKESSKRIEIEEGTGAEPVEPEKSVTDGEETTKDTNKNAVETNGDQSNHVKPDSDGLNKSTIEKKGSLKGIHKIHEVEKIQTDEIGVEDIDKVFRDTIEVYGLFVEHTQGFRNAVIDFEKRFTNVNKKTDFEKCFESYLKSLDQQDSKEKKDEKSEKDEIPIHTLIQNIKKTGDGLLETINSTGPKLDKNILEAEKFDPKEHLKGTIKDGGQKTLLAKSGIPTKYRKNLKNIKKARKLLDDVFSEVEAILALISQVLAMAVSEKIEEVDEKSKEIIKDAPIDGEVKVNVDVTDAQEISQKEPEENNHIEATVETEQKSSVCDGPVIPVIEPVKIPTIEPKKAPELEKSTDDEKHHEREKGDEITPLPAPSRSVTPANLLRQRADSWDGIDGDADGRLMDYGSFLVLDPSADDIVLMRRSKSLDSLTSIGSRRSMSRYGSYEFVTNFEITIAEKSEANRAPLAKKSKEMQQLT